MVNNPPNVILAQEPVASGQIWVLAQSEEQAKRVEVRLRSAGHRVRVSWMPGLAQLEKWQGSQGPDLILAASGDDGPLLEQVLDICRRRAPSVPVLAMIEQLSPEAVQAVTLAGARDAVSSSEALLPHLEKVCLRELSYRRQIRELSETRALLADYEARYAQLVLGTGDAVAHIREGIVSGANPALAMLLGYSDSSELEGLPLMDLVCADHQADAKDRLMQLHNGKIDTCQLHCRLHHHNGGEIAVAVQLTRGTAAGERFLEFLIRAGAVAAAGGDGSGAKGRVALMQALSGAGSGEDHAAALFVVVDAFQGVEARVGFDDAERVLIQAESALRTHLPPRHELFRFSTHEFAAIVYDQNPDAVEKLGDAIARDIGGQVFSTPMHEAQLTLTVGTYPLGGETPAAEIIGDLVRETRRQSMRGGNTGLVLGAAARAEMEKREAAAKAEAVREALDEGRFKLAYQTIASLEGDAHHHFDVLIRMTSKSGEDLTAAEFIGPAEQFGLMCAIDRWVVSRTMRVLATRESRKLPATLFVRLSADTLKDSENFLSWLNELLAGRPLKRNELCFEIQELVLQNHIRKAKMLTDMVGRLGAQIAVDHFGIGSNSEALLQHLPVHFLKFHRSFTQNFDQQDVQRRMSRLMEIAKQKGIKTIVSHVEDANAMARMWQMGVNYIEGFHVQEPEVVMITEDPLLS
jgi:PAS domain S-box-containing protein